MIAISIVMISAIIYGVILEKRDKKKTPDHGSYDDLIKYRRGRSKH